MGICDTPGETEYFQIRPSEHPPPYESGQRDLGEVQNGGRSEGQQFGARLSGRLREAKGHTCLRTSLPKSHVWGE